MFVRERAAAGGAKKNAAAEADLPGMTFSESVRTWRYWALAITFFIAATTINGSLIHVVPLLTDRGISVTTAVSMVAAAGPALILGRVFAGYIIDHVFAPYVAMAFLIGPLLGLGILGGNVQFANPIVGTILLGLGIGAEVDLMSFIVTRYFGLRAFGALYGLMFAFTPLGNAAGASGLGWSFQLLKSYSPAFAVFGVLLVVACILLGTLGPYRYPARAAD
jgi:MFS family permease